MTYMLTIFGVDNGGNIMPPVVLGGVAIYEIEEAIMAESYRLKMKSIDTVMMVKEGEHGQTQSD